MSSPLEELTEAEVRSKVRSKGKTTRARARNLAQRKLRKKTKGNLSVVWAPQAGPQTALLQCPVFEIFYGGARGGGKTDGMLGEFLVHANEFGQYSRGIFLRREATNLEEAVRRSKELYYKLGAKYNASSSTWTFTNGATLKFRHLWDDNAADKYQGHSYTRVYFEELTQWPDPAPINKLRATCRSADGVPCGFRGTGNPGGPGHNWVKARYISPAPKGYKVHTDPETLTEFVFIPAKLADNRYLVENDPNYENVLRGSGNETLVRAWLKGDWDIVAGGFFDDVWNPDLHVLNNFVIPRGWDVRLSFDWGSARPSSLGMWAITDGSLLRNGPYKGREFPRGSIIRFNEWYTVMHKRGQVVPNKGMRHTNAHLGANIMLQTMNFGVKGSVADPSIFTQQGGPSIYAQMKKGARDAGGRIVFKKADNNRVAGWTHMRQFLSNSNAAIPENPGLWVMERCTDFIRTVPILQRDDKKWDDLDTEQEDHVADEARYMVMSVAKRGSSKEIW